MSHSFVCPRCGAESHHPMDALEGYCGACRDWTRERDPFNPRHYRRDGTPMTMREWTESFGRDFAEKVVAKTKIGDTEVSTVWLGLDHNFGDGPPLIFETMIFGGPLNDEQWRYPTEAAALAGHDQAVAAVRAAAHHRAS